MDSTLVLQWVLVLTSSLLLFFLSPVSKTQKGFFSGSSNKAKEPGILILTTSLAMSWIMAKSVTNTANLGASFGMVGGITYAVYYLSFLVAGITIYRMRLKGKFESIHQFLETRYGKLAVILFTLLIGIRLFNEVWSNTTVIGSYFGEQGSLGYVSAILIFTLLTLGYSLKGGLRSSLITDAFQMVLFGILLFSILSLIFSSGHSIPDYVTSGTWSLETGLNLFLVALIQIFSYPFHDPVLTDRGFIAQPSTTLKSYLLASLVGFTCITLFGFIGIYAGKIGIEVNAALEASKTLGVVMTLLMNFIMITSAASTLDSTFTSVAKLVVIDLNRKGTITLTRGRIVMILIAVGGSVPLFFSPKVLSATTISGTMVLGLAPIFLLWNLKAPKISFLLSYGIGILSGLSLLFKWIPSEWHISSGPYTELLTINLFGTIGCFIGFLVPYYISIIARILILVQREKHKQLFPFRLTYKRI